jgi:hypothetical protein
MNKNTLNIIAPISILVLGIGFSVLRRRSLRQLKLNGVVAEGEVLEAARSSDDHGLVMLRVRFTPFNADYAVEIDDFIRVAPPENEPAIGSTIQVIYKADKPVYARLARSTGW